MHITVSAIQGQVGEQHLRLGRGFAVAGGLQGLDCFDQHLVAGLLRDCERLSVGEEQPGPLGIVEWPELERGLEVALRRGERRSAPPPGRPRRGARGGRASRARRREPRGASEVERGQVVVGEQLGLVVGPSERLDPLGRATVLVARAGHAGSGRRRRRGRARGGRRTRVSPATEERRSRRRNSLRSSACRARSAACARAAERCAALRARRPCRSPPRPGSAPSRRGRARRGGRR